MTHLHYKKTAKKRGRPSSKSIEEVNMELQRAQEHQLREARRIAIVNGGSPEDSSHPLGVLYARKQITQGQHDAGMLYACLFGRVFGKTVPSVPGDVHREISDEAIETCERRWREASALLMGAGRAVKDEVENAAVYHRFLPLTEYRPKTRKQIERVRLGLQILDRWIRG